MEIPEVSFRVQFDAVNGLKGKESIYIRCGNMPNSNKQTRDMMQFNPGLKNQVKTMSFWQTSDMDSCGC